MQAGKNRLRIQRQFELGGNKATPYWVTMLHWLVLIWEITEPFSFHYAFIWAMRTGEEYGCTNSASLMHIRRSAAHTANMTHHLGSQGVLGTECSQHIKSF